MEESKVTKDKHAWLRGPWQKQAFKAEDAIEYRSPDGARVYTPASQCKEQGTLVPGGWDHEHCDECLCTISESPGTETEGYTNGKRWLCQVCYETYLLNGVLAEEG